MSLKMRSLLIIFGIIIGCTGMYVYMKISLEKDSQIELVKLSENPISLLTSSQYFTTCSDIKVYHASEIDQVIKVVANNQACKAFMYGVIDTLTAYGVKCKDIRNGYFTSEIYNAVGLQQAGTGSGAESLISAFKSTGVCEL